VQTTPIGASYRLAALENLAAEEFDVLVVGGGVVGAGAALDAVSRGLTVALVEARDWAAGTSSRSSKLIHGGLRYLEQRDFGLVREALTERGMLLNRIAPHLVRPVPFLLPLRHRAWERAYIGAGVLLYDTVLLMGTGGRSRALPRHRHLTKAAARRMAPGLDPDSFVGAIQYYDAQMDDARYTMTLARTAAQYGAQVTTRTRVTALTREGGKEGGRVTGAIVRDLESDKEIRVRAKRVISATGVWTEDIQELAKAEGVSVRAAKGVHLVVPKDRIDLDTGLIARTEKSVLFVIPWGKHWLIGTTDTDWHLDRSHPAASKADIDYLLEHVNAVLAKKITRDDIEGVYAGLRPLVSGADADGQTTKLSREHVVVEPAPGMVIVTGGKYTTYRVMAKDAVDAAFRAPDPEPSPGPASASAPTSTPTSATAPTSTIPESVTDSLTLLGGDGYHALWNERARLARNAGLTTPQVEHLLQRYGSCIDELLELISADPELGKQLGKSDYLRVEAVYAASHEGALHLEDVLTRRTRISIEEWDRGLAAAPEVAELIAPVLGWDEPTKQAEIQRYRGRVEAERASQEHPDDSSANEARRAAADLFDIIA
jgi:glycerol-3-phosphate dehydrogenase